MVALVALVAVAPIMALVAVPSVPRAVASEEVGIHRGRLLMAKKGENPRDQSHKDSVQLRYKWFSYGL